MTYAIKVEGLRKAFGGTAVLDGVDLTIAPGTIVALLADFGLLDARARRVKTYSGGMRRRLDLAIALIARPPVLFLDEPTTGLDPRSREQLWGTVRELARDGVTVLLTTQYLEEADQCKARRRRTG
jgi:ABC-2 type transport system ATP-binding protein